MESYLDHTTDAFIRYFDFPGDEPTVVFLTGLGLASTAVYPRVVLESGLSSQHSILVDLFGCGYSDRPENYGYSLEEHASTLSGLLDYVSADEYVIVGHSFGGAVAIELSAKRSDLIGKIILAEANMEAGNGCWGGDVIHQTESDFTKNGFQTLIEEYRQAALIGDQTASIVLGMWQVASPHGIYRGTLSVEKRAQSAIWDQLIRMTIPKTFIFGGRSLEEYEKDRELYTRLETYGIRVYIVPDAAHTMMVDNPIGTAKAIFKALG